MSSNAAPQILVVEDEREIRELMALHLLRQGYGVKECSSVEEGLAASAKNSYSLVVLDWMLPGLSGIDFLDQIRRQESKTNVLMVTAKAEPEEIVLGLEKGADDYLTKPFQPAVFLARVKALLRRAQLATSTTPLRSLRLGSLNMNFETYDVSVEDEKLHLTPSEFKLLATMVNSRGKVMTRERLIDQIQGEGVSVVGRTVDTHVFGLRKKLGSWADNIETIRGVGYRVRMEEN